MSYLTFHLSKLSQLESCSQRLEGFRSDWRASKCNQREQIVCEKLFHLDLFHLRKPDRICLVDSGMQKCIVKCDIQSDSSEQKQADE